MPKNRQILIDEEYLVSRDEFLKAFEKVMSIFVDMKEKNIQQMDLMEKRHKEIISEMANMPNFTEIKKNLAKEMEAMYEAHQKMMGQVENTISEMNQLIKQENETGLSSIKKTMGMAVSKCQKMMDEMSKKMNEMYDSMNTERDKMVKEMLDSTPKKEEILNEVEKDLPKFGVAFRDGLELLQGDERLDKKAIRGIEDIEKNIKEIQIRPTQGGGKRGIQLFVDGSRKGLTSQSLNLIAGTNVTLTYSYSNGRNDVTISASGGSGVTTLLTATGTVNDSNVTFTFASEPVLVVVNGTSLRNGHGCTIVTTTVTLDQPVGTGGDIYGISF